MKHGEGGPCSLADTCLVELVLLPRSCDAVCPAGNGQWLHCATTRRVPITGGPTSDHAPSGADCFLCHYMDNLDEVSGIPVLILHQCPTAHLGARFALFRTNELIQLRRQDIEIKTPKVDAIFGKCLWGEERLLTHDKHDTHFEIYLRNRKGWQQKTDWETREPQQCESCHHCTLISREM